MDDKVKHMFIVLILPTISVFKHYKNALNSIHRLAWVPMLMGPQATDQRAHALRRHWFSDIFPLVHRAYGAVFLTNVNHRTVIAVP